MELVAVKEATKLLDGLQVNLTEADKEFVVQFAFRTGDTELTNKLIDELCRPDKDRDALFQKYEVMVEIKPDWIRKIENLLITLEQYRIQEEKAIGTLSKILSAYGIHVTKEELKNADVGEIKARLKKEASL